MLVTDLKESENLLKPNAFALICATDVPARSGKYYMGNREHMQFGSTAPRHWRGEGDYLQITARC